MIFFLIVVGILQILFGLVAGLSGPTVMQEAVGAICFGFGILSLAAATIIDRLEKLNNKANHGQAQIPA